MAADDDEVEPVFLGEAAQHVRGLAELSPYFRNQALRELCCDPVERLVSVLDEESLEVVTLKAPRQGWNAHRDLHGLAQVKFAAAPIGQFHSLSQDGWLTFRPVETHENVVEHCNPSVGRAFACETPAPAQLLPALPARHAVKSQDLRSLAAACRDA